MNTAARPGSDAGYIAAWRPVSVSAEAAVFARAMVNACGPHSRDRAKNLLFRADLRAVRGADVTRRSGGVIAVVRGIRPRVVPVLARYHEPLLESVAFAGEQMVTGGTDPARHRLAPCTPVAPLLDAAAVLLVVTTADAAALAHVHARLGTLADMAGQTELLLSGRPGPYPAAEISETLGVSVAGRLLARSCNPHAGPKRRMSVVPESTSTTRGQCQSGFTGSVTYLA